MSELIYEINKEKYLLVEFPIFDDKMGDRVQSVISKYDCITQSCDVVDGGMWGTKRLKVRVLVPFKNIDAVNKEKFY